MMNRRRVLLGGLGVLGVLGLGAWGIGRMGAEAEIIAVLRRRLSFLNLDEDGLHLYAKDQVTAWLSKRLPTWNRLRYHFKSAVAPSFTRYYRSADTRSRIARAEDSIASTFLLSSDFFRNGADESRVVKYLALYDPMRACTGDPFSRPAVENPITPKDAA